MKKLLLSVAVIAALASCKIQERKYDGLYTGKDGVIHSMNRETFEERTITKQVWDKRGLVSIVFTENGQTRALDYLTKSEYKNFLRYGSY